MEPLGDLSFINILIPLFILLSVVFVSTTVYALRCSQSSNVVCDLDTIEELNDNNNLENEY